MATASERKAAGYAHFDTMGKSNPQMPIRFKPDEKARLKRAAAADGYTALGSWMKHVAKLRADELNIE
jgi:hypothetical protein